MAQVKRAREKMALVKMAREKRAMEKMVQGKMATENITQNWYMARFEKAQHTLYYAAPYFHIGNSK